MKIHSWLYALVLIIFCTASLHAEESNKSSCHMVRVSINVPDTTWSLYIKDVYIVDNELWAISQLQQLGEGMVGLMMITKAEDEVLVTAPKHPVKHFILGKTWGWENEEKVSFINDLSEIQTKLDQGKRIFSRAEQP